MAEASWTLSLAQTLGCAEPGLKLVLGQIFGYPICYFHTLFLKKSPAIVQHLFFAITGALVSLWAIGVDPLIHGSICILVTFIVTRLFKGTLASTIFLFVFQLGYLVVGYFALNKDTYDISWTMPHCVMTLRLIGLAMDVHDGQKNPDELARDQKEAALRDPPSLIEMFSHSFFIGGYLVGPQFSMRKYKNFVQRNIEENITSSVKFGLTRFGIGACYLIGHLAGSMIVPEEFVESDQFLNMNFGFKKCALFSLWAKVMLAKYMSLWLLAEGIVILSGLAYNGRDANGSIFWNGGANVKLMIYENSTRFQHMIDSFNINTNAWVMSYIYKRLRFLNNKILSQLGALAFLAIWHGYHSGYYVSFFCEFLIINFEKQFFPMLDSSTWLQPLLAQNRALSFGASIIGKIYYLFFLPHCFLPFALLKSKRYVPVMLNTYAGIFVFFGTWILWRPLAKMILRPERKERQD